MTEDQIYNVLEGLRGNREDIISLAVFGIQLAEDQVLVELTEPKIFEPQAYYNFIDLVSNYISNVHDIDSLVDSKEIAEHEFIANWLYHEVFVPTMKKYKEDSNVEAEATRAND